METTIGYIVIFGLGIAFASFYLYRNEKKRELPVSEQAYPQLIITILIRKKKGKLVEIILQLKPIKKVLQISYFHLELTNNLHEKEVIDLKPVLKMTGKSVNLQPGELIRYSIQTPAFQELLKRAPDTYDRFRFVVETSDNKKFKSHLLALSKRWGLFKQDTGRYN